MNLTEAISFVQQQDISSAATANIKQLVQAQPRGPPRESTGCPNTPNRNEQSVERLIGLYHKE
jgi:hypothetical protein